MRSRQEILEERRRLLRGNRFLKDDVRIGDAIIEKTAVYVRDALSQHVTTFLTQEVPSRGTQPGGALLDLAAAWALTQPEFVALIHRAIDDAPDLDHSWSRLTRAELDAQVAALEHELAKVEREERRRPLLAERDRVNEQLASLGD